MGECKGFAMIALMMLLVPPIGDIPQSKSEKWVVTIEQELVGNPAARARSYRQTLLRQKPGETKPSVLFEQTSTGSFRILHRGDGLVLLMNAIGAQTTIFFCL